jgi:hypothetical protein
MILEFYEVNISALKYHPANCPVFKRLSRVSNIFLQKKVLSNLYAKINAEKYLYILHLKYFSKKNSFCYVLGLK